ncbi:MAG TPA: AraC family transcriptional regulator [Flavobacterium sp.]|nr:AraC family transcriptional regulator [Flavobacterium sp.]
MIDFINEYGYVTGIASYLTPNDTYITQYRNVYQIIWLKKGSVTVSLTHLTKKLEVNDCLFLGKNEMFRLTSDESYELYYIQFTDEFYCMTETDRIFLDRCSFFNNSEVLNLLKLEEQYIHFVSSYLSHLKYIHKNEHNHVNVMMAHNTIQRILLFALSMDMEKFESFNTHRLSSPLRKKLREFNELIKKHIKKERTVQFYADELNIHVSVLKNICKEVYGITPKKFIAIASVNEAKVLLKHTELSIKEIAYELNFDESSNFVRFFKTAAGIAPAQYRERVNQFALL